MMVVDFVHTRVGRASSNLEFFRGEIIRAAAWDGHRTSIGSG